MIGYVARCINDIGTECREDPEKDAQGGYVALRAFAVALSRHYREPTTFMEDAGFEWDNVERGWR